MRIRAKGLTELRISVVQQIAATSQASPLLHRHVSLLLHPVLVFELVAADSKGIGAG